MAANMPTNQFSLEICVPAKFESNIALVFFMIMWKFIIVVKQLESLSATHMVPASTHSSVCVCSFSAATTDEKPGNCLNLCLLQQ